MSVGWVYWLGVLGVSEGCVGRQEDDVMVSGVMVSGVMVSGVMVSEVLISACLDYCRRRLPAVSSERGLHWLLGVLPLCQKH